MVWWWRNAFLVVPTPIVVFLSVTAWCWLVAAVVLADRITDGGDLGWRGLVWVTLVACGGTAGTVVVVRAVLPPMARWWWRLRSAGHRQVHQDNDHQQHAGDGGQADPGERL
jgi:hypothetical protein